MELGGHQIGISASVGVCTASRSVGDPETLFQCVDHAMYRAKALGKNCYQVYPDAADRATPPLLA
jgi:GGDEF domain-containing protein